MSPSSNKTIRPSTFNPDAEIASAAMKPEADEGNEPSPLNERMSTSYNFLNKIKHNVVDFPNLPFMIRLFIIIYLLMFACLIVLTVFVIPHKDKQFLEQRGRAWKAEMALREVKWANWDIEYHIGQLYELLKKLK